MVKVTRVWFIAIIGIILLPKIAGAVCLDPKTWVSGYRVPFEQEFASSIAIVVGRVVGEKRVFEEPGDPEYFSSIFTVRLDRQLKGNLPESITVRMEYDSGRYAMAVGERHVLFIRKWPWEVIGADYVVDVCGNSSELPAGDAVVAKVVAALSKNRTPAAKSQDRHREN